MIPCFAYIRVSTVRQGEKGVSLLEQKAAIEEYARRNGLDVIMWFEERETAAKRGRPAFTRMVGLLQQKKALGVIMHKIDRGARNLRDWADLRDLHEAGIAVHFANENLDLYSRGGRLSADIQAVVAADYIDNLREETKKGIYGRLKQGLLPLAAPLGYVDNGPGKVKTIDPLRGPLVREAFERYATGAYTLRTLSEYLSARGLRNRAGRIVCINSLSIMLNNTFYIGLITVKKSGETYPGVHEPLVSPQLFARVQDRLRRKSQTVEESHDFLFRRRLQCAGCGNKFVGERQRGHVYYRCHKFRCPGGSVREETVEETMRAALQTLTFTEREKEDISSALRSLDRESSSLNESSQKALKLRLDQISTRLMRLTDAYLDGEVEKSLFEERKRQLLFEQKDIEEQVRAMSYDGVNRTTQVRTLLERADTALLSYLAAPLAEKKILLEELTSNITVYQKNVAIELRPPFSTVANRNSVLPGSPEREDHRSQGMLPRAERSCPTSSDKPKITSPPRKHARRNQQPNITTAALITQLSALLEKQGLPNRMSE